MLIIYHREALREMHIAAQHYEDQSPELGDRFLDAIDDTVALLMRFPSSGRDLGDGVRCCPLRRFPFSVVYDLRPDVIVLAAIAHHRRAPGYWRDRL
jgi:plasmid stabilization system protein ParE